MSNVIDFEGYYWERRNLEALEEARSDPEGLDAFVEPGSEAPPEYPLPDEDFSDYAYEALPGPGPACGPRPRTYDLKMLSGLTAKLGRESGFNLGIDETALEAAFHFAKEQAGQMNVPLETAFEIAAWAVLDYERGRRDPPRLADPPF